MKKINLYLFFYSLFSLILIQFTFGQEPAAQQKQFSRSVEGKVISELEDRPIYGATVTLRSIQDSLMISTDEKGQFRFRAVLSSAFTIKVKYMGYTDTLRSLRYNDTLKNINIPTFKLHSNSIVMDEVVIQRRPAIIYKTDTIEYNAERYSAKENAPIADLIKQMEGVEVDDDGKVTYNGKPVPKLRLNGRDYLGGEVANAIKSLPAEIVDKIQFIDDYGDQAALNGIKDGEGTQTLNIVTRLDKSVGNMLQTQASDATNGHYAGRINATRLDKNKQIGAEGNLSKQINGIAGRGTPGFTLKQDAKISYANSFGKKLKVNGNYSYNNNKTISVDSSSSVRNSTKGTTFTNSTRSANQNTTRHSGNISVTFMLDSATTLQGGASILTNLSRSTNSTQRLQTGLNNQLDYNNSSAFNSSPNWKGSLLFNHRFKKRGRNFSSNISADRNQSLNTRDQNDKIIYMDSVQVVLHDSLIQRIIDRESYNKNIRSNFTYSEPIDSFSTIDLKGLYNYRSYDNIATTANNSTGTLIPIDSLTNIFKYSFTQMQVSANYRYRRPNFTFSLGMAIMPTILKGFKSTVNADTYKRNLLISPVLRAEKTWSKTSKLSINYSSSASEPTFEQIQPVRDVTNPQNPIIGNPNLKPSFSHNLNFDFNKHIDSINLTFSVGLTGSLLKNKIVNNVIQVKDVFDSYRNETYFQNIDGAYQYGLNHSLSKRSKDKKLAVSLNGNLRFNRDIRLDNDLENFSSSWDFSERLKAIARIWKWLEFTSQMAFDYNSFDNTLPSSIATRLKKWSFQTNGKFIPKPNTTIDFSMRKNFSTAVPDRNFHNPFVIDISAEQIMLKRRNGTLKIQIFDLLNQNNAIERRISSDGYTDSKSSLKSRYFIFTFAYRMQKWTKASNRNGAPIRRRGDGSFIDD